MDTLKIANTLQNAGFERKQSETLAELFKKESAKKRLIRLEILSIATIAFGAVAFGYLVSLLNTIYFKNLV